MVYNHRKNRATIFVTKVKSTSSGAVYNLQALEYKITRNRIVPVLFLLFFSFFFSPSFLMFFSQDKLDICELRSRWRTMGTLCVVGKQHGPPNSKSIKKKQRKRNICLDRDKIWCLDSPNQRLVSFLAADLSAPTSYVPLPSNASFFGYSNNVAYDFGTQRVFLPPFFLLLFVLLDRIFTLSYFLLIIKNRPTWCQTCMTASWCTRLI